MLQPEAAAPRIKGMKGPDIGLAVESRALECAIIAFLVLLAADTLRAELAPLWRTLRLLFDH